MFASFNDSACGAKYVVQAKTLSIPEAQRRAVFSSDPGIRGCSNVGNARSALGCAAGRVAVALLAKGLLVVAGA